MQNAETAGLLAELPPPLRLAVAYAPARARTLWMALLLLDQRLSRTVAGASEPILAQLKLAWWRDRMQVPASQWPDGEPLLAELVPFDGERSVLEGLVDAWEGLLDDQDDSVGTAQLAGARANAVAGLARIVGCLADEDSIKLLARRWTSPDPAQPQVVRLPRALRPLLILANLPRSTEAGPRALLRIVRLGLLGR